MKEKASLLRVYISETDKIDNTPLYEVIVKEARDAGLAGATVHRGILSFGASHANKSYAMSTQVPVVIEIADDDETVRKFAKKVQELIGKSKKGALITIQPIEVIEYKPGDKYNQFRTF